MSDPDPDLFGIWRRLSEDALRGTAQAGQQMLRELVAGHPGLEIPFVSAAPPSELGSGQWFADRAGTGAQAERPYRLFVPECACDTRRVPLLVLLHGCGQDSAALAACSRAAAHARHKGFAVLMPEQTTEGNPQRCWNWFAPTPVFELEAGILMAIIERVCTRHPIAEERVFALGLSAGGAMAMALGLRHTDRFRAVGSHSAPVPLSAGSPGATAGAPGLFAPGRPSPLILLQGDADPVVAPANADACAALWRARQGADSAEAPRVQAVQRGDRRRYSQLDWGPEAAPELRMIRVHGLGHAWSGGARGQGYADPDGPDALRLAWQFFDAHAG